MQIVTSPNDMTQLLTSDYEHVIIHLAWYRDDNYRALIFGMLELVPKEFPKPISSSETSNRLGSKGRRYLYVRRFVMPVEQALKWYNQCRDGDIVLPEDGWDNPSCINKFLEISGLMEEPTWPQMVTTSDLPFVPDCHICPRVHHLIPVALPEKIKELKYNEDALTWLSQNLFFDLRDYPEYFGSIHFVAPNPVFRGLNNRLAIDKEGKNEVEMFQFMTRAGHTLDGLQMILIEQRPTGMASVRHIPLQSDLLKVEYIGDVSKVETVITCPHRGVLYSSAPHRFVKTINLSFNLITGKRQITVPATKTRESQIYEVTIVEDGVNSIVGQIEEVVSATEILYREQAKRELRHEGKRLGQRWFHGEQAEAEKFVKELIGRAHERVVIVDPYFGVRELFLFAMATSCAKTEVIILTSAEVLKNDDDIVACSETGLVLLKQLEASKNIVNISVRVMPGEKGEIHDRFLIIDNNEVWLSGNSLNEIGKRAGIIVKLPSPAPILSNIDAILNKCQDLKTWVENRQKRKTNSLFQRLSKWVHMKITVIKKCFQQIRNIHDR